MPVCDICAGEADGKIVAVAAFRRAVLEQGFDPFALGLCQHPQMASWTVARWKIMVAENETDWALCRTCQRAFVTHLENQSAAQMEATPASGIAPPSQPYLPGDDFLEHVLKPLRPLEQKPATSPAAKAPKPKSRIVDDELPVRDRIPSLAPNSFRRPEDWKPGPEPDDTRKSTPRRSPLNLGPNLIVPSVFILSAIFGPFDFSVLGVLCRIVIFVIGAGWALGEVNQSWMFTCPVCAKRLGGSGRKGLLGPCNKCRSYLWAEGNKVVPLKIDYVAAAPTFALPSEDSKNMPRLCCGCAGPAARVEVLHRGLFSADLRMPHCDRCRDGATLGEYETLGSPAVGGGKYSAVLVRSHRFYREAVLKESAKRIG